MYLNVQFLLGEESVQKNGFDYIAVRKDITNETMGNLEKNLFSEADLQEIKKQSFVADAAPLLANNFRIQISGGDMIPFMSDFFIEALDKNFIDTLPPDFSWQEGQEEIPLIVASDFLEIFNVFAPGYGLPQLSEETVTSLRVLVICYGPDGSRNTYRGRIVALSDRINSILVPTEFLNWANSKYSTAKNETRASRVYIKTKDANNPAFLQYLNEKHYEVNKDKTKFGRVKAILQAIFSGLGLFGLLVVLLALLLFSFYLRLLIANSKNNLQLLLTLGYAPDWLSRKVTLQFLPVYIIVILSALLGTEGIQYYFYSHMLTSKSSLSILLHPIVIGVAGALLLLALVTNFRMVRKLMYRMNEEI